MRLALCTHRKNSLRKLSHHCLGETYISKVLKHFCFQTIELLWTWLRCLRTFQRPRRERFLLFTNCVLFETSGYENGEVIRSMRLHTVRFFNWKRVRVVHGYNLGLSDILGLETCFMSETKDALLLITHRASLTSGYTLVYVNEVDTHDNVLYRLFTIWYLRYSRKTYCGVRRSYEILHHNTEGIKRTRSHLLCWQCTRVIISYPLIDAENYTCTGRKFRQAWLA